MYQYQLCLFIQSVFDRVIHLKLVKDVKKSLLVGYYSVSLICWYSRIPNELPRLKPSPRGLEKGKVLCVRASFTWKHEGISIRKKSGFERWVIWCKFSQGLAVSFCFCYQLWWYKLLTCEPCAVAGSLQNPWWSAGNRDGPQPHPTDQRWLELPGRNFTL